MRIDDAIYWLIHVAAFARRARLGADQAVQDRTRDLLAGRVAQRHRTRRTAARALVRGTGGSPIAVIVPRAFFVYSISMPLTMKRASSGSE